MPRLVTRQNLRTLAENGLGAALPAPKKRKNEESEMQRDLIIWWREACKGFGVPEVLLFSIPNGGGGGLLRGFWLKAEGLRKGAPDLMLAVAQRYRIKLVTLFGQDAGKSVQSPIEHHALFLELKTPIGRLDPEQEVFHGLLRASGYRVEVVRSLEQAQSVITEYLKP